MKRPKRPKDFTQLAKPLGDMATGEAPPNPPTKTPEPTKASAGRRGGLKGGKARARSPKERSRNAKKAADARWRQGGAGPG